MYHLRDIVRPSFHIILRIDHIHSKIDISVTLEKILHECWSHPLTPGTLVIVEIQYGIILIPFREHDFIAGRILHRQHSCVHTYQRPPIGICKKPHLQTCILISEPISPVQKVIVRHIYSYLVVTHYPGITVIPIYIVGYLRNLLIALSSHDESVRLADNLIWLQTVKDTHDHIDIFLSHGGAA